MKTLAWASLVAVIAVANLGHLIGNLHTNDEPEAGLPKEQVVPNRVTSTLSLVKETDHEYSFKLEIENAGDKTVFVMAQAVAANGSRGPYVFVEPDHPSVLLLSEQVFSLPPYSLYRNDASVSLIELRPSAAYTELISVPRPVRETLPPYGDRFERVAIDQKAITHARMLVGVLRDDEAIRDIISRKPLGPIINGVEMIELGPNRGRSIRDLQELVESATISLPEGSPN